MTNAPADLGGVFAAAVTPLTADLQPDLDALPRLLDFLAERGCHGALVLGTTGEGPSLSVEERRAVIEATARYRDQQRRDFKVLAGTGCANLAETASLTRAAFDLGVDGVVVLPPFYYKGVGAEGVAAYFDALVRQAVPAEGRLLLYHIPHVSGVPVPAEAVAALRQHHPRQVWGMKDSQDDRAHTLAMAAAFPGFAVFAGSDSLMTDALTAGGAGTITALANVTAPLNRAVWDAHRQGQAAPEAQARLARARQVIKGLNGPAAMKAALAGLFGFPAWPVRPPLVPLPPDVARRVCEELGELLESG